MNAEAADRAEPRRPGTSPSRRGRLGRLLAFAVALLLAAWAVETVLDLATDRQRRLANSERHARNLAASLANHGQSVFRAVDLGLLAIRERIQELDLTDRLDDPRVGLMLGESVARMDAVLSGAVVDAGGTVRAHTVGEAPDTVTVSDRPYFRILRDDGDTVEPVVDRPIRSRLHGRLVIPVSRSLRAPDGSFRGVVAHAIDPQVIADYYARLDVGRNGVVALFSEASDVLVRVPDHERTVGTSFADRPLFTTHLQAAPAGYYLSPPQSDGVVRLTAYRRIAGTPLVVAVALDRNEVLAPWHRDIVRHGAVLAVASLLLGVLVFLVLREGRRLEAAQERLAYDEARFRDFAEASADWFWETDPDHRVTYLTQPGYRYQALTNGPVTGRTRWEAAGGDTTAAPWPEHLADLAARRSFRGLVYRLGEGPQAIWLETSGRPVFDAAGAFLGYRGAGRDITEQMAARDAIDARARQIAKVAAFGRFALGSHELARLLPEALLAARDLTGADMAEIARWDASLGLVTVLDRSGFPDGADAAVSYEPVAPGGELLAVPPAHAAAAGAVAALQVRSDGPRGLLGVIGLYDRRGGRLDADAARLLGPVVDILAQSINRIDAEDTLLLRQQALEAIGQGVLILDVRAAGRPVVYANPAVQAITGYLPAEVLGRGLDFLNGPGTDAGEWQRIDRSLAEGRAIAAEIRHVRKDGDPFLDQIALEPIRGFGGTVTHFVAVLTDATDARRLEEQLRQSQRMEAVGQLTGGVAHDFNNMLTIILGNAEMLLANQGIDGAAHRSAAMIRDAADRGAKLTQRLLAFGRRQTLRPTRIDLAELVEGVRRLLERTLGENIEVRTAIGPDAWPVHVDPAQLENALVNLTVNARDAMPEGGALTIEASNVELEEPFLHARGFEISRGPYVRIAVSDTGTGMSEAVRQHAFEPFFTTKEVGRGSGLGLSMVYGFVRQSGGAVTLYSEAGRGTTVSMYLPRSEADREQGPQDGPPSAGEIADRPPRTVLVVEDNDMVREHVGRQVHALGYRVLVASNGPEALALLQAETAVDLLFSDLVMPGGMDGRQLAEAARRMRPDLRVLLTSGYAERALARADAAAVRFPLLGKPYRMSALADRLRLVLDAPVQPMDEADG